MAESIRTTFPTRGNMHTELSAPPDMGPFDPFALLRGLRLPAPQRRPGLMQEQNAVRTNPAPRQEYDYEPTFGQLNAAGGITPYQPGQATSGLTPVVATGFRAVPRR